MNKNRDLLKQFAGIITRLNGLIGFFLFSLSGMVFAVDPNNVDISSFTQGLFTPSVTDRSIIYLGQLFGSIGTVLQGNGGQLLSYVFVVFNLGIWIIAGAYVIYTTLFTVVNAAHEGEFMGRKMHTMVPVRVVAGVAALLPKFSGYSFIQVLVMWVVVQGVGFADSVWNSAIDFFHNGGVVYQETGGQAGNSGGYTSNQLTAIKTSTQNILNAEICMYSLQKVAASANKPVSQGSWVVPAMSADANGQGAVNGTISFGNDSNHALCGSFAYSSDKEAAVQGLVNDLFPIAYSAIHQQPQTVTYDPYQCLRYGGSVDATQIQAQILAGGVCQPSNQLVLAISNYLSAMTFLRQSQKTAAGNAPLLGGSAMGQAIAQALDPFSTAKAEGWILAGKYYQAMASANQTGTATSLLSPDDFTAGTDSLNPPLDVNNVPVAVSDALGILGTTQLKAALTPMDDTYTPALNGGYFRQVLVLMENLYQPYKTNQQCSSSADPGSLCDIQNKITDLKNRYLTQSLNIGANNVIDTDVFHLMQSPINAWFDTVLNPTSFSYQDPVARVRAMGLKMIEGANHFWSETTHDVFMVLGVSAGVSTAVLMGLALGFGWMDAQPEGGSGGANYMAASTTAAQFAFQIIMARIFWYLPLGIALSAPIFVLGATLGVYIPLIPFMLFTFAALGWFIMVLEAMVAAPLVALGVTHPEGHDLLGKADQAVMLLLGVFLKPVLLVTGLLAGIILTFVAGSLLDAGFFPLMYAQLTNNAGVSGGTQFVAIIGLLVIYTMAMMAIVDQCFSLIYVLSDRTLRWIGGHPEQSTEGGMLQQVKSGYEGKLGEGAQAGGQQVSAIKSSGITLQTMSPIEKKKGGETKVAPKEAESNLGPDATPASPASPPAVPAPAPAPAPSSSGGKSPAPAPGGGKPSGEGKSGNK